MPISRAGVAFVQQGAAFADGDDLVVGREGSNSRNRHTPEKSSRPSALSPLLLQRCSKNSIGGTASRSQSYSTSSSEPQDGREDHLAD